MKFKLGQKIIDKIRNKEAKFIPNNTNYPICLTDNEKAFLLYHIKNAQNFLEFGSGGSTFLALLETEIPHITSIESDMNWIVYLRKWETILKNEGSRLKFQFINIGKTGEWGVPIEPDKRNLFPAYSSSPFENNEKYDVIFIDGRFRVACALQSLLYCDNTAKILMHDFNNRPEYHVLLDFLDIVDTCDTMALFRIKDNCDEKELKNLWEKYKYVWE